METAALLAETAGRLRSAGIETPEVDARQLLQAATGWSRTQLLTENAVTATQQRDFEEMITRRAEREPLQHITGVAYFRHVELAVGPGAFVPRPET